MNSGAVESGKKYHCTPLQSLDAFRHCLLQYHQVNGHFLRSVSILPMLCYFEFFIVMKQFDFKKCLYFHSLMLQLFWKI